jgi:hypothetical protein
MITIDAAKSTDEIREVLGAAGNEPTMPPDNPGVVRRPPTSTGPDRSYAGNAWAGSCASTIARRPETPRSSFRTLRVQ